MIRLIWTYCLVSSFFFFAVVVVVDWIHLHYIDYFSGRVENRDEDILKIYEYLHMDGCDIMYTILYLHYIMMLQVCNLAISSSSCVVRRTQCSYLISV